MDTELIKDSLEKQSSKIKNENYKTSFLKYVDMSISGQLKYSLAVHLELYQIIDF